MVTSISELNEGYVIKSAVSLSFDEQEMINNAASIIV